MQEFEFPERESTISAIQKLVPTCSMQMPDGAVLFSVSMPWQLAGAIIRHLNTSNIRRLDHKWAGDLAQDMATGEWRTCYDPITLTTDWHLYNGQHRLFASWKAQADQDWIVIMSGNPDVRKSTDGGKKRNIQQTHGLPNTVASVVNFVMLLEGRAKATGITRAAKLTRHARDPGAFDHYTAYFARYPLWRESHVSAAFAFAEIHRPQDAIRIRRLAEDLAEGFGSIQISKQLDKHMCSRRQLGIALHSGTARYADACLLLRGIQAYLVGADLAKLEAHPGTLNWFDPVSP